MESSFTGAIIMKKDKKIWGVLCLILPFFLVGIILYQGQQSFEGTEYRIRIMGYDPRDVLRGHYIQFLYEWPIESKNLCRPQELCVACFTGNPESPNILIRSVSSLSKIHNNRSCTSFWILDTVNNLNETPQPTQEQRRFYVPEIEAPLLEKLLRENESRFEIGVISHKNGEVTVKNLYIDGVRLQDYLKD
jgi:hypothetical protein